ncbi:MAG: outer membrane beta-barrel protein [Bacteroidia bacterium]
MKKLLLLVSILALTLCSFAQEAPKKPAGGDWGIGFRIQGLGNILVGDFDKDVFGNSQILARRYFTNRIAVRASLGINARNGESRFASSITNQVGDRSLRTDSTYNVTTSALTFSFAPGAEYHLQSAAARLDPYVGFSIPIGFQSATTTEIDDELKITDQANGEVQYSRDLATKRELDGGLSFGFSALIGFNYFVSSNIALGAEYNLGLMINSIGGNYQEREVGSVQQSSDPTDVISIDNTFTGRIEESATNFNLSTVGVNLSIFW